MSNRAVVLLSGGLDSTLNLYMAHEAYSVACALTVDYGQRAFEKEKAAASRSCQALEIEHNVVDLKPIFAMTKSSLVDRSQSLPTGERVDISSPSQSQETAKSVWVANRNGVFLSLGACLAESLDCQFVIPGFNKEEAETFPDNSSEFVEAFNKSLQFSTMNQVKVLSLTQKMDKIDMYRAALKREVPLENIWSCYQALEKPCGKCESCLRSERARQAVSHA